MVKMLHVAIREFLATVLTKGFLFGIIMMPVMILIAIVGMSVLMKNAGPKVEGTVAVIDRTGKVGPGIVERFTPEAIQKEQEEAAAKATEAAGHITQTAPLSGQQRQMAA